MYNKIFSKILDSSIWLENDTTRIVWFTFLASMDEDGVALFASIPNLAHRARVGLVATEEAVKLLESPDKHSSDPDHEGRRIERIPGGWIVLNAIKYRELVTRIVAREQTRNRVARHRELKRSVTNGNGETVECNAPVTPSVSDSVSDSVSKTKQEELFSFLQIKINSWFKRRPETQWSETELKKLKNVLKIFNKEDFVVLDAFYSAPNLPNNGYRRKDIATLLNNWNGEVDRARGYKSQRTEPLENKL